MLKKKDKYILLTIFTLNVIVGGVNLLIGNLAIGAFEIICGAGEPLFVLLKDKSIR